MLIRFLSRNTRGSAVALVACSGFAMLAGAATTVPKPPATICVGANCVSGPVVPGNIKWHPGHYVWVSGPGFPSRVQASTYALLNATANNSNLAGIQIIFKWADLEGATAGDYSAGFAMMDALLAKLAALPHPKRLMISVIERSFGTANGGQPNGLIPQYVINMPSGVAVAQTGSNWSGGLNAIARLDNPAVMDRLIALAQAYGKRYDSNPLVEMYGPMDESAVGGGAGINASAYVTQMQRLYAATSQAWPSTLVRWRLNFAPADSADQTMLSLLAFAKTLPNSAIGGPDPEVPLPIDSASYPSGVRVIQANMVFRGLQSSSHAVIPKYEDLRAKMPWVGEYQGAPRIGAGNVLPNDFGSYEINVMHASHIVYIYNTWTPYNTSSSDPHKWAAQLAYIDSVNGQTYAGVTPPK
jgi:hypothetical protein